MELDLKFMMGILGVITFPTLLAIIIVTDRKLKESLLMPKVLILAVIMIIYSFLLFAAYN